MAGAGLYPRGTIKRITKAHTNRPLSKNVDILMFLDYMLFMENLVKEATIYGRQRGERGLSGRAIKKVRNNVLQKFKG